jgi:hypothetical protein
MRKARLLVIAALICTACNQKAELGQHVFLDNKNVIHLDKECKVLQSGKLYAVHVLKVSNLTFCGKVCARCVSYDAYREIESRVDWNTTAEANRKWLYERLKEKYDIPSYEVFVEWLKSDISAEWCYKVAKKEGFYKDTFTMFLVEMNCIN